MEDILPLLEAQLRQFRADSAGMNARHPGLARHLGPVRAAPDPHVDRLLQGVATLHARTALALQRARRQQDEHLLELHFPGQLRPFPECRIGPMAGMEQGAVIASARYCAGPGAALELEIDLGPCLPGKPPIAALDIYVDGDAAFSAALRHALLAGAAGSHPALARTGAAGDWRALACWPFAATGLEPEQGLLPRRPGAHAGLALLREYFIFPARFNVLRLDLSQSSGAGRWALRLPVAAAPASEGRLLESLHAGHLRAGWTASARLQRIAAAPVTMDGRQSEYLLSVAPDLEIFSIDSVHAGGAEDLGWIARRVDAAPAGHEWRIAFHGQCIAPCNAVVSIDVTCCRRDKVLARAVRGAGCRWQLNSLLALEQLPLDAAALRELMATQAIANSQASQAIIAAVHGLDVQQALLRAGRAAPLPGMEVRLQVDEGAFAGCGLPLFGEVMDRFFGECAHINTFTRLVLVSAAHGGELMRCKARNAGAQLE